ncbi:putative potassium ion channel Yvc1 [Aspergillus clavatus NRRL 1]|uniref:Potassium ion channel Yvc1, putative n=1 Tax=Aspergillus clavatus (strain ATCC 1007 / CBS 513.65 / DSM 816 / NCTC 3887 / NRRL 1 / QM 1276 / 107) TaxID=344612 RepID=A1CLC0_ASPCL|nr:potassium ion channel Yvc1, putative [Aspergillus clavatus NRRL 1]EAW09944.1 potassium ion channel Yvc1, putative [Aspergillus clavatus NRRL 1]
MGHWRDLFSSEHRVRQRLHEERRRLLPAYAADQSATTSSAKEVTKVALRLKYQIEQVIPFEIEETAITKPNSRIITHEVVRSARQAGGDEYRGCVIYCLLICLRWFKLQAVTELWDSDLLLRRALACEIIAKRIIESEDDHEFLLQEALLKRYSIFSEGEPTTPANVIERAVDLHALTVIGSSGYQKCIKYLWRGWFCQEEGNPTNFVPYHQKDNTDFRVHFHPDRMRTPLYQNACQILFSLIYLLLYTAVINTVNPTGNLDFVEGVLYAMTLAYICDELAKLWKVGRDYFEFWNAFNSTLYTILAVSFFLRVAALVHSSSVEDEQRKRLNELSYSFLAMAGPMFWMRMMLYLDTFRFFGAMFVVLRVMMKESLIFFALLFVILIGFFQAFYGMAQADDQLALTGGIVQGMANSIMQSPEFGVFEKLAFPFGLILYYVFNFIVMIVLLNILIALYNSAYEDISGNAVDEYMAIFSLKTMQFVRAPDENVFIPPFNLLEIIFLVLPFEWWMPRNYYARLNDVIMGIIYSPLLLITATLETREARRIRLNRRRGEEDDDEIQEWEQVAEEVDFDVDDTWRQMVRESTPDANAENTTLEIMQLREKITALTEMVQSLLEEKAARKHTDQDPR